jgi:hypothetical protein
VTPSLVSDALAFDVSNSARRRLRIPSVFTISKSNFLAEDLAAETKEGIG